MHGSLTEAASTEAQLSPGRGSYHAADSLQTRGFGFPAGALVAVSVRNAAMDVAPRQVTHVIADAEGAISATLASGAGPFLVTSPNTAVTLDGGSTQVVTWSVANTNVAPVNAASVKISLSVDSGITWAYVLAASTPNSGSRAVVLPAVPSTKARVKVEAVDNIFFDVSNVDFTLRLAGDVNADGTVDCADLAIVKASFGKRTVRPGFDPRADVNGDGVVDIRDLSCVSQRVPAGTVCH